MPHWCFTLLGVGNIPYLKEIAEYRSGSNGMESHRHGMLEKRLTEFLVDLVPVSPVCPSTAEGHH